MRKTVTILFLFMATLVYGQKRSSVTKAVDIHPLDFTMSMKYMLPRRFAMKSLTSEYYVTVRNDSLDCFLPYYGEVYQTTLTNEGLNFKAPIVGMRTKDKKNKKHIYYRVRRGFLTYDYHFVFYPEGNGMLILTPSNAQNCTYEGEWENH